MHYVMWSFKLNVYNKLVFKFFFLQQIRLLCHKMFTRYWFSSQLLKCLDSITMTRWHVHASKLYFVNEFSSKREARLFSFHAYGFGYWWWFDMMGWFQNLSLKLFTSKFEASILNVMSWEEKGSKTFFFSFLLRVKPWKEGEVWVKLLSCEYYTLDSGIPS